MLRSRILVVEDEQFMQTLLRYLLTKAGYDVTVVSEVFSAQNILHEYRVQLVITDIMMSGIDGLELCRWIKKDSTLSDIPVIILSSLAQIKDLEKGKLVGADYYLTKPFDVDELLSIVNSICCH